MIDVNAAISSAMDYVSAFSGIFPNAQTRLEETELDDDDMPRYWLVTLSFVDNPISGHRLYRLFKIDASTGEVKSMKARAIV